MDLSSGQTDQLIRPAAAYIPASHPSRHEPRLRTHKLLTDQSDDRFDPVRSFSGYVLAPTFIGPLADLFVSGHPARAEDG